MPATYYPHAPITEALVDFRVQYKEPVTLELLKDFGQQVRKSYPMEANREMVQAQFLAGPAAATSASSSRTTIGYIFHTDDRRQAVQVRLDGFTFSRFTPYETWDKLIVETRQLWGLFVAVTKPKEVNRAAVRYINQIDLPLVNDTVRFEDYLHTLPQVGTNHDQPIREFLLRVVLPQNDIAATLILTEALLPPQKPGRASIILDIDLFKDDICLPADSEELWNVVGTFRARKNEYFEASITNAARELFK